MGKARGVTYKGSTSHRTYYAIDFTFDPSTFAITDTVHAFDSSFDLSRFIGQAPGRRYSVKSTDARVQSFLKAVPTNG